MSESKKVKLRRLNNFKKLIEKHDIVQYLIMRDMHNRLLELGVIKNKSFKKPRIVNL